MIYFYDDEYAWMLSYRTSLKILKVIAYGILLNGRKSYGF